MQSYDYVHVEDLAMAHLTALEYTFAEGPGEVFNCGYGHGFALLWVHVKAGCHTEYMLQFL